MQFIDQVQLHQNIVIRIDSDAFGVAYGKEQNNDNPSLTELKSITIAATDELLI